MLENTEDAMLSKLAGEMEDMTPEQIAELERTLEEADAAAEEESMRAEAVRESLGKVLVKRRDEAVKFRMASGIEQQWLDDQAYYEGDDSSSSNFYKGLTGDAPLLRKQTKKYRSKVFLNITRPYVETAASKVIEVLSPVDDRNFSISATPIPSAISEDNRVAQGYQDENGQPLTPAMIAEAIKTRAAVMAKGAQDWIDDRLSEADYPAQLRILVDDASRLGTGVIKGPYPTLRKSRKMTGGVLEIVEEIIPTSVVKSCWDIYPDPACGDNIHNGQYLIERDRMVEKQVRDLMSDPRYNAEALAKVIEQGPKCDSSLGNGPNESSDKSAKRFDVWYYYGFLTAEELIAMDCDCDEAVGSSGVPAVVTMINDTPVKAHLSPLTSGRFPFDMMVWQRVAGSPWGIGIARQIRACQAILNETVRSLMDNAGLSSGPQIVVARGSVVPADGSWEITPRKVWLLKPDSDIANVGNALSAVQIPSIQGELLQAVEFALKMAENVTGLPVLLQGQQGANGVPETVGGMQILVANASSLLRRMARIFDDYITKPHVTAYYEWLLEFGEDDSIKGDFQVIPRGSSALVARDIRNQFMSQALPNFLANPAFGIDPKRYFAQIAKLNGIDPEDVQYTKQELEQIAQSQQPVVDPRIEVAKIRAESDQQIAAIEAELSQVKIETNIERDTAFVQAQNQQTAINYEARLRELELKRELAILEMANREKLSSDQLKVRLAEVNLKSNLQRELSIMGNVTTQAMTPPAEPAGRAQPGRAFEQ